MSIQSSYKRLSYLVFRIFYTLFHLLAFYTLKSAADTNEKLSPKKNIILLCGIEPEDDYSSAKLAWFIEAYQKQSAPYEIILLSKITEQISEQDGYTMVPWHYQTRARLLSWPGRVFFRQTQEEEGYIKTLAERSIAMVDLGNQQLSSDLGTGWTANMLSNMVFAKAFTIPFHVFPQFFGPTHYPVPMSIIFKWMIRSILPSAKTLCVRDEQSKQALSVFFTRSGTYHYLDVLLYQDGFGPVDVDLSVETSVEYILSDDHQLSEKECLTLLNEVVASDVPCNVKKACDYWPEIYQKSLDLRSEQKQYNVIYITNDYYSLINIILSGNLAVFMNPDRKVKSIYDATQCGFLMAENKAQLKDIYLLINTGEKLLSVTEQFHRELHLFLQKNTLPQLRPL